MFNSNQKQKIESGLDTKSKEADSTTDQKNINLEKIQSFKNQKKSKTDPVQILLGAAVFIFLAFALNFLMGPLSMISMTIGGALSVYHLIDSRRLKFEKGRKGRKGPSFFFLVIIGAPFLLGGIVAYEGISLLESPFRIILLWGLTISFWTAMLFIPMSIVSRRREDLQPELTEYPKVTIIIPAFNEEKVVKKTIESIIESQYPKKDIIVVDDGSTDNTLRVASNYKNQITVLHKKNGGKASALNYGLVYAKGEIIVVVDADTIIGRRAIREIVKGFGAGKKVAAVAGNIKVKNRVNWITKCQALEYIVGIQLVRRAFDAFGSITIIPGALGAFKKECITDVGSYNKDTIVEDYDQTIKILKAGLQTKGSIKAVGYTEAPNTVNDFVSQRKRWYRGNVQVLTKHSDALTNPQFGYLQKMSFPFLFLGMVITPIIGFVSFANAIFGAFLGDVLWVLSAVSVFMVVNILMTALAIRIDNEDQKLLLYSPLLLFGFKQIIDLLLIRAIIEHVIGKKSCLD